MFDEKDDGEYTVTNGSTNEAIKDNCKALLMQVQGTLAKDEIIDIFMRQEKVLAVVCTTVGLLF